MLKFPQIIVRKASTKIVTWSDGTDEEIKAMIEAADAGQIDLNDYWSVGDERVISLKATTDSKVGETHAAQDSVWVLMDTGENSGYVFADGTPVHFVSGMKGCLNERGYMNSSATSAGSWKDCFRRRWCNNTFPNSFEDSTRELFKSFKTISYNDTLGGTITLTDEFALWGEKEIFGKQTHSYTAEANALKQIEYYKTSSNIQKWCNDPTLWGGVSQYYWERSMSYDYANAFCNVEARNGSAGATVANWTGACVAPFGCI